MKNHYQLYNYVQDTKNGYFCLDFSNNGIMFNPCNNRNSQKWYNEKYGPNYTNIVNNEMDKCLDIKKDGSNNLDIRDCDYNPDTPGQRWLYNPVNNVIQNSLSGSTKCLDTSNGLNMVDCYYGGFDKQWFKINITGI